MSRAKLGDRIKIHYTERLENGRVIDTSKNGQPLEITIGGNLVPVFEKAAIGMEIGETKAIRVPPKRAHGPRREELIMNVKKSNLPRKLRIFIGQKLRIKKSDDDLINAVITDIKGDTIILGENHPPAGGDLIFEIELINIIG